MENKYEIQINCLRNEWFSVKDEGNNSIWIFDSLENACTQLSQFQDTYPGYKCRIVKI